MEQPSEAKMLKRFKLESLEGRIFSGPIPESAEGFKFLRKLGVETIFSLDDVPSLDLNARKAGVKIKTISELMRGSRGMPGFNFQERVALALVSEAQNGKIAFCCYGGLRSGKIMPLVKKFLGERPAERPAPKSIWARAKQRVRAMMGRLRR